MVLNINYIRRFTIFTTAIILFTIFTIKSQPILAICGSYSSIPPSCTYPNLDQESIPPAIQCDAPYSLSCCQEKGEEVSPGITCIQGSPTVPPVPTLPPGNPTNTPTPQVSEYDCTGFGPEIYISGSLPIYPICDSETATITILNANPEDSSKTIDIMLQPPQGTIEKVGTINVQVGATANVKPSTGWFGNGEQYIVYLQSNTRCSPNVNLDVRGCNAFPTPPGGCGGVNVQCGAESDPPCCTDQNLICDQTTNPFTCQVDTSAPFPTIPPYNPCKGIGNPNGTPKEQTAYKACWDDCASDGQHAWTAFGCFPTDPSGFATFVIKILFGVAGGVAFLLIIYGAFLCITSNGDPQKVQACKETITSAIVGLIMLIFALAIISIIFGPVGIIKNIVPVELF